MSHKRAFGRSATASHASIGAVLLAGILSNQPYELQVRAVMTAFDWIGLVVVLPNLPSFICGWMLGIALSSVEQLSDFFVVSHVGAMLVVRLQWNLYERLWCKLRHSRRQEQV